MTDGTLIPGKENLNFCCKILEFTCPINLPWDITLLRKVFHPHSGAVVPSSDYETF